MKLKALIFLVFVCLFQLFSSAFCADTTQIICNDFSDVSKWQLNNHCKVVTNSNNQKVLRLTPSEGYQAGSAFLKDSIPLLSSTGFKASFSASFSFQITNSNGSNDKDGKGADGIVFVIQTINSTVGSLGGGIGYQNIGRSLGIEFDTWLNLESDKQDKDGNHVAIDTGGNLISKKSSPEAKRFNDGNIWYAWVDYDGDKQIIEVRYSLTNVRPSSPNLSDNLNLPPIIAKQDVFVGFTSATGSAYNDHDILSFNFVNKFQPFTYNLSLSASPDTAVKVNSQVTLTASVRDMDNLLVPDSAKKTQWSVIDSGGNPLSILKSKSGAQVLLIPTIPNSKVQIEGSISINGKILLDTITIHVKALDETYNFSLSASPDTTLKVNEQVTLTAMVRDMNNSILPDSAKKTKWRIIQTGGNPLTIMKSDSGPQVFLTPTIPNSQIKIQGSVSVNGKLLFDTITIHVKALDVYTFKISNDTTVKSHDSIPLIAIILDKNNNVVKDSTKKTIWKIITPDGNPQSVLRSTKGENVLLAPVVPYSQMVIQADITIDSKLYTDIVNVRVTAGDPYKIFIESNTVNTDTNLLRHAVPIDTVFLINYPETFPVYAIVRDRWGGYCRLADPQNTSWATVTGADVISVQGVQSKKHIGQIIRTNGTLGEASVSASEQSLISDTVQVKSTGAFLSRIQIRDRNDGIVLTSISMKVNESRVLDSYGLIAGKDSSNKNSWVLLKADWSVSESILSSQTQAPKATSTWTFTPLKEATGTITVKSNQNPLIASAVLKVTIIADKPPHLIKATYTPSGISGDYGVLKLVFSEEVDLKMLSESVPINALIYFSSEGKTSGEILGGSTFSYTAENQFGTTISIRAGSGAQNIIPLRDSIAISSGTVNCQGISPDKANIRKVPLEIDGDRITIAAIPNPGRIGKRVFSNFSPEDNFKIRDYYSNVLKGDDEGTLIVVTSLIPLKPVNGHYGTAKVYDALGNLVASNLLLVKANPNTRTQYGVLWDGINKNNRSVSKGTYLVQVTTFNIYDKMSIEKTKFPFTD